MDMALCDEYRFDKIYDYKWSELDDDKLMLPQTVGC